MAATDTGSAPVSPADVETAGVGRETAGEKSFHGKPWLLRAVTAAAVVFAAGFVVMTVLYATATAPPASPPGEAPATATIETSAPLSVPDPAGLYRPPTAALEPYPGSDTWAGLPTIAYMEPEGTEDPFQLRYPAEWWNLTGPTVFARYSTGHSRPLEFVTSDGANVSMSVADLFAADPSSLGGLTLTSIDTLAATIPDAMANVLNRTGELGLIVASPLDPDAAEQRFWNFFGRLTSGGYAYNTFTLLRAVSISDFPTLLADLAAGDELGVMQSEADSAGWRALAESGDLYVIDVRGSSSLQPRQGAGRPAHAAGALLVLTRNAAAPSDLTVAAVHLSSLSGNQVRQYTRRTCTPTAWAQAIYFASTGLQNWVTWIGHVLQWHIVHASMAWTQKNNMSPDHPLSVALAPGMVGNPEFLNRLNPPTDVIFGTATLPSSLEAVFDYGQHVVDSGVPGASIPSRFPQDYEPVRQAALNGLQEASFTGEQPWDQLPGLAMAQRIWEVSRNFASVLLDEIYPEDSLVAGDAQLQAWLDAAADPAGSNLPIDDVPQTREALLPFLTYMVYGPLTHTWTNLPELHGAATVFLNNVAAVMTAELPDPGVNYTEADLLQNVLPGGWEVQRLVSFWGSFMYAEPYRTVVPPSMDLAEDLYPEFPADHAINAALIEMRQEVVDILVGLLDLYPPEYCAAELQAWAAADKAMASLNSTNPWATPVNATAEVLASEQLTRDMCLAMKTQRLSADINL